MLKLHLINFQFVCPCKIIVRIKNFEMISPNYFISKNLANLTPILWIQRINFSSQVIKNSNALQDLFYPKNQMKTNF